jgi:hypothetical protein
MSQSNSLKIQTEFVDEKLKQNGQNGFHNIEPNIGHSQQEVRAPSPSEKMVSFGNREDNNNSPTTPSSPITEPFSNKLHQFVETHFNKPTFCQWCSGFIWYEK